MITTVAELPLDAMLQWRRAGFIIYKQTNEGIRIVVGIDEPTGDISNFAGSAKLADKTVIRAAKREFVEETLGVFGNISDAQLENAVAIYGEDELIIFCCLNYDEVKVRNKFAKRHAKSKYSEMKSLLFCTVDQFIDYLAGTMDDPPFYSRVRDLVVEAIFSHGFFLE